MSDRELIIRIRNKAVNSIEILRNRPLTSKKGMCSRLGKIGAFQDILDMINSFYEEERNKEDRNRREKLSEFKSQLKSLYTELERELDAGRTWSAAEVNEEVRRLKRLTDELQSARREKEKPIGRKPRIEL